MEVVIWCRHGGECGCGYGYGYVTVALCVCRCLCHSSGMPVTCALYVYHLLSMPVTHIPCTTYAYEEHQVYAALMCTRVCGTHVYACMRYTCVYRCTCVCLHQLLLASPQPTSPTSTCICILYIYCVYAGVVIVAYMVDIDTHGRYRGVLAHMLPRYRALLAHIHPLQMHALHMHPLGVLARIHALHMHALHMDVLDIDTCGGYRETEYVSVTCGGYTETETNMRHTHICRLHIWRVYRDRVCLCHMWRVYRDRDKYETHKHMPAMQQYLYMRVF